MRELSIFIDESGVFRDRSTRTEYFLISMAFHDQSKDINSPIAHLNSQLSALGLPPDFYIHTGPIIRREGEYKKLSFEHRKKLFAHLFSFFRKTGVTYQTFKIRKNQVRDAVDAAGRLSKQIADFIIGFQKEFYTFDVVKVYYDNGQQEVSKIVYTTLKALLQNVEPKRPQPSDYKLFQVADLICTLTLISFKLKPHKLSKSELVFFHSERKLKKNYLKLLAQRQFRGEF